MREQFIKVAIVASAAMMLILGVWMRLDPAGFAAWANWPEHEHFLHDLGCSRSASGSCWRPRSGGVTRSWSC